MRRNGLIVMELFLIFIFSLIGSNLQAGVPRLELSEKSWDWGRVPQNSVLSHTFWLKNVGTDTLREINVKVA